MKNINTSNMETITDGMWFMWQAQIRSEFYNGRSQSRYLSILKRWLAKEPAVISPIFEIIGGD